MSASATGLRSTLAMPGRASSNDEICEPPSSAGMKGVVKVAASYTPPAGASRKGAPGASPTPREARRDQGSIDFGPEGSRRGETGDQGIPGAGGTGAHRSRPGA